MLKEFGIYNCEKSVFIPTEIKDNTVKGINMFVQFVDYVTNDVVNAIVKEKLFNDYDPGFKLDEVVKINDLESLSISLKDCGYLGQINDSHTRAELIHVVRMKLEIKEEEYA